MITFKFDLTINFLVRIGTIQITDCQKSTLIFKKLLLYFFKVTFWNMLITRELCIKSIKNLGVCLWLLMVRVFTFMGLYGLQDFWPMSTTVSSPILLTNAILFPEYDMILASCSCNLSRKHESALLVATELFRVNYDTGINQIAIQNV